MSEHTRDDEAVIAEALVAALASLSLRLQNAETALERIAEQQPRTLATLRKHGVVFDGPLGNDPKNWQHVAFSIYTDLCEADHIARAALASSAESDDGQEAEKRKDKALRWLYREATGRHVSAADYERAIRALASSAERDPA